MHILCIFGRPAMTRIVAKKKKREREEANRWTFTDLAIRRLKPPEKGQKLHWDEGQTGLSLLVSSGGCKTFRATYNLNGAWISKAIGRFGEVAEDDGGENVNIGWARKQTADYRRLAKQGIDPEHAQP